MRAFCGAAFIPALPLLLPCYFDGTDVPCSSAEALLLCR